MMTGIDEDFETVDRVLHIRQVGPVRELEKAVAALDRIEAREARLREALREIADMESPLFVEGAAAVARRALDAAAPKEDK